MGNFTAPFDASNSSLWKTPLPYLLGGASIIMALIAFALSGLLCPHREDSDNNDQVSTIRSGHGRESTVDYGRMNEMREIYTSNYSDDKEKKLIVIMAGDELPSFIAMPTSVSAK